MANPSLKAQIEAAKSALSSDLAAPSVVAHPKPPTAPIMAGTTATGADADTGTKADSNSTHATNAANLDERITRLEAKLSDNQRDLHTLLQKIREVSRLHTNSNQSHENPANDQAKTMVNEEAGDRTVTRRNQRSPVIMFTIAALLGLVVGIAYFLVTARGDPSALTVPSWIPTFIDSFNGWTG